MSRPALDSRNSGWLWLGAWIALSCLIPQTSWGQNKAAAEEAFRKGREFLAAGDIAEACEQFQLSQNLDPAIGTLLNLGDCNERLGKLATAWALFVEARDRALSAADNRAEEARRRVEALEPRLSRLRISPPDPAPAELRVTRNGQDVTKLLGVTVPVDPGQHTIEASGPAVRKWTTVADLRREGITVDIAIPALEAVAQPSASGQSEEQQLAASSPVRARIYGVFDYKGRGAAAALGVGLAPLTWLELSVHAVLGPKSGGYAEAAAVLGRGRLRPRLGIGLPVFVSDGARVGMRGLAGVTWLAHQRAWLSVELGLEHIFNAEADREATAVVPLIGVQVPL